MAARLIHLASCSNLAFRFKLTNTMTICKRFYTNKNLLKLNERKLLQDIFPDVSQELQNRFASAVCVYAGFDPTADSLHIGNLLVLMVLLHAQRAGHDVIAVIGGATALIGDPSGRTSERVPLQPSTIEENISGINSDINNLFNNHQRYFWKSQNNENILPPIRVFNNMNWYSKMTMVNFLSTFGKHFRMGTMLLKHSVQSRISSEVGMSFAEFAYQTFQAYDWLHLYDKYNCTLQIGGMDQKGNVTAGHDLISRMRKFQCYGLFVPLAVSETGHKLGKSSGTPVWLNPKKTSPYEFYQFFLRVPDSDVESLLLWYTFLSVAEINTLIEDHMREPEKRKAQKKLAELLTLLVHGEDGLKSAKNATRILFNGTPELLATLSAEEMQQIFEQAPSANLMLNPGITIMEMLIQAKFVSSEAQVKHLIDNNGLTLNFRKVDNADYVLILGEHILPNFYTLIRFGKKNYYLVRWMQ